MRKTGSRDYKFLHPASRDREITPVGIAFTVGLTSLCPLSSGRCGPTAASSSPSSIPRATSSSSGSGYQPAALVRTRPESCSITPTTAASPSPRSSPSSTSVRHWPDVGTGWRWRSGKTGWRCWSSAVHAAASGWRTGSATSRSRTAPRSTSHRPGHSLPTTSLRSASWS